MAVDAASFTDIAGGFNAAVPADSDYYMGSLDAWKTDGYLLCFYLFLRGLFCS